MCYRVVRTWSDVLEGVLVRMASVLRSEGVLSSVDPASGRVLAEFPVMDADEVRDVVERVRVVAPWWAARSWAERERCLLRWAAWLVRHADELVDLLTAEQGKPRDTAFLEIVPTLEHIRWAAHHAEKVLGTRSMWPGLAMSNHTAAVEYRPYGVVGVIGPWNYPIFTPVGQMAAYALAAGNAVVLKPSEFTPQIGKFAVDSFALANPDVPRGVLSLVTGLGETGAALCRSGVDKIAFTGSTPTGKRVLAACAENLVPAVLECGGKDAMIVAEDADVPAAAKAAAWGAMTNAGQTCVGIEQVYVVAGLKDRFLAELGKQLDTVKAGSDPAAPYGPMTTGQQLDIVRSHIDDALTSGAIAVVGGRASVRPPYIDPVVLLDPSDDSSAVREATFGPVLAVRTVSDTDGVALVNSRKFALGAKGLLRRRGRHIAGQVRSGMVAINTALAFVGVPSLPFGGVGDSGFGRVHGADGLREFAVAEKLRHTTVRPAWHGYRHVAAFAIHDDRHPTIHAHPARKVVAVKACAFKRVPLPACVVWDTLADHEGMSDWSPGITVTLQRQGEVERDGVGAIRRVTGPGITIREEVTGFESGRWLAIVALSGIPLRAYRGEVFVTGGDEESAVSWTLMCDNCYAPIGFVLSLSAKMFLAALVRAARRRVRAQKQRLVG